MTAAADTPIFEAVIVPHRSLSRRGRMRLLSALGLLCGINAAVFIHMGAWPVGGFTGIELLLAGVLLQVNAHGARASEIVLLTAGGLHITRTDAGGSRRERRLPAAWLRMTLEEVPGRAPRLLLQARELREEIGASLGEAEKRDLAAALQSALLRWRSPVFDNPQLRTEPRAARSAAAQAPDGWSSLPSECISS